MEDGRDSDKDLEELKWRKKSQFFWVRGFIVVVDARVKPAYLT
jgi:hypothetical protein